MTKAKLNVQFDYITLRVVFADGAKLNLTKSRYGIKLSGACATQQALDYFDALTNKMGGTVGDKMESLRGVAARSENMQNFIANCVALEPRAA